MKFSEMNAREKKAFLNIKHAANDLLGGLENTLQDYTEDEDEYKREVVFEEEYERAENKSSVTESESDVTQQESDETRQSESDINKRSDIKK